jgi:hypothetical protein
MSCSLVGGNIHFGWHPVSIFRIEIQNYVLQGSELVHYTTEVARKIVAVTSDYLPGTCMRHRVPQERRKPLTKSHGVTIQKTI